MENQWSFVGSWDEDVAEQCYCWVRCRHQCEGENGFMLSHLSTFTWRSPEARIDGSERQEHILVQISLGSIDVEMAVETGRTHAADSPYSERRDRQGPSRFLGRRDVSGTWGQSPKGTELILPE